MKRISLMPWLLLFIRLFLFAGIQALFALFFFLTGSTQAWETSANWWIINVALANLICLTLLICSFRAEGRRYWDIFRIQRATLKQDLWAMAGIFLLTAPISFLPNILLGGWLFGDSSLTLEMIVRPLPIWAVYLGMLFFPVTQGLVEIAFYFSFIMPKLDQKGIRPWLALGLPSLFLALQHIAVPLLLDGRFILWRALMFLPFAFLVGIVMRWRPRLLPYLAILHIVMDFSLPVMFLASAY